MNNVVDMNKLRERRALKKQYEGSDDIIHIPSLPPIYEEKLNEENLKVLELLKRLNKLVDEYGDERAAGGPITDSILIPIEALNRQILMMVEGLDKHMLPEFIEDSNAARSELGELIADTVHDYYQFRGEVDRKPVYQHEMYAAMVYAMNFLIYEHRMFQIQTSLKGAASTHEISRSQDVQEERPE